MPNSFVEEVLANALSRRAFEERVVGSLRRTLQDTRREALEKLGQLRAYAGADGDLVDTVAARMAAEQLLADIDDVIAEGFDAVTAKITAARGTAFRMGVGDVAMAVDSATGGEVKVAAGFGQVFREAAKAAANSEVLGLKVPRALAASERNIRSRTRDLVTNAIVNGENLGATARRIRDASNISERAAMRVARTNIIAAQAMGQRMAYAANPDVFSGFRWDATLDSRACIVCARLHGTEYALDDLPPHPAHPNCRCQLVGIFADPDLEEAAQSGTRLARDEDGETYEIPADEEFESWLRDQPEEVQADIIGDDDVKLKLWRRRMVSFDDLASDELEARSTAEVVQRALAAHPQDVGVRNLAEGLGVQRESARAVAESDDWNARRSPFSVGVRPGTEERVAEIRRRMDELKRRRLNNRVAREGARAARAAGRRVLEE